MTNERKKAYEKAQKDYRQFQKASENGDVQARKDKVKAHAVVQAMQREDANDGTTVDIVEHGDRITIETKEGRSKRSCQEEYISKFDAEAVVKIGGEEQTLQEYHTKRLLRR